MDFQNNPPFERPACFYVTVTENVKRFQCFNFEIDFLENGSFSKKLEYRFLIESTKIANTSVRCKTAKSEGNFKTKW